MTIDQSNIDDILAEHNQLAELSKSECEIMLGILKDKKDKCGTRLGLIVRKWKTKPKEKKEVSDEYVKLSNQVRIVEARLKSFDK